MLGSELAVFLSTVVLLLVLCVELPGSLHSPGSMIVEVAKSRRELLTHSAETKPLAVCELEKVRR